MKILLVEEREYVANRYKNALEVKGLMSDNEYFTAQSIPVRHLNDKFAYIREKEDGYYSQGEKLNVSPLLLDDMEIPIGTYLIFDRDEGEKLDFSQFDKIICVSDYDEYGILSFKKYMEDNGLTEAYIVKYNGTKDVENMIADNELLNFNEVYKEFKQKIIENNFESPYARDVDILKLRLRTGMGRNEFAKYFNVPYRTLQNWELEINLCPVYLASLMEYKLKSEGLLKDSE